MSLIVFMMYAGGVYCCDDNGLKWWQSTIWPFYLGKHLAGYAVPQAKGPHR